MADQLAHPRWCLMARSEARLSVTIWDDDDFLALSLSAQRMFMFLISQVDLAHDGVIALRERRWSKRAAGLTVAQVARDLEELSTARFVVVDEDAEELLVRSFIRRDKVYRQPNVLRAAADHLPLVTSPRILAVIAEELRRVSDADDIHKDSPPIVAAMLDTIGKAIGNPPPNPSPDPSGNPSRYPSEDPSGGMPAEGASPRVEKHPKPAPDASISRNQSETDTADALSDAADVSAGDKPSGNPSRNPSRKATAGTPGERGVVTAVSRGVSPYPVPRSPGPNPSALAALDASDGEPISGEIVTDGPALFVVPDPPGTDLAVAEPVNAGQINRQWIDYCKGNDVRLTNSHIKRYGAAIKRALAEGFDPELVKRALGEMLRDRVTSRPALFDNYLIRVQQGPELPPRRASRTESSMATPGGSTAALIRDALTRPA